MEKMNHLEQNKVTEYLEKERIIISKKINEVRDKIKKAPTNFSDKVFLKKMTKEYKKNLREMEKMRSNLSNRIWKIKNYDRVKKYTEERKRKKREELLEKSVLEEDYGSECSGLDNIYEKD